jgi:hypothetical protein
MLFKALRGPRFFRFAIRKLSIASSFLALGGIGLTSGSAHALAVNVRGELWNISTVAGRFESTPGIIEPNPWASPDEFDSELAFEFAQAVGSEFGLPNTLYCYGEYGRASRCTTFSVPGKIQYRFGPLFAYGGPLWVGDGGVYEDIVFSVAYEEVAAGFFQVSELSTSDLTSFPHTPITWATATPVPGPLPIFGAAAAFAASRRLRKRVKASRHLF